jgi:NAD(P)H-dependent FMN reductase
MLKLQVFIVSTREGRVGHAVGLWFYEFAVRHGNFDVELVDLAAVNLPMFDEPHHPRLRNYQHEHAKAWSARVDPADAFVFVTPEYNFSAPPSLVNALDYLNQEWAYKPAAFVSYGGVSGGTRAVQAARGMLSSLRMMAIPDAVHIPFFTQFIDRTTRAFVATDVHEKPAGPLLDELHRWAVALKPMRSPAS